MENFFLDFTNKSIDNYKYADIKEIGMELDWFSHVYGRTLLVGNLKYESYKNYRCKKEFTKKVLENPLNAPTAIFIHDWTTNVQTYDSVVDKFGTFTNMFANKTLDEYTNRFIFNFKPPRVKENGKPEKYFNVNRKKRFRILVTNGIASDDRLIGSTTISCTFRDLK